jgi:hypothetical protein
LSRLLRAGVWKKSSPRQIAARLRSFSDPDAGKVLMAAWEAAMEANPAFIDVLFDQPFLDVLIEQIKVQVAMAEEPAPTTEPDLSGLGAAVPDQPTFDPGDDARNYLLRAASLSKIRVEGPVLDDATARLGKLFKPEMSRDERLRLAESIVDTLGAKGEVYAQLRARHFFVKGDDDDFADGAVGGTTFGNIILAVQRVKGGPTPATVAAILDFFSLFPRPSEPTANGAGGEAPKQVAAEPPNIDL